MIELFERHELLARSSALAFQVLTAVVPFGLFLIGLAGFLGLEDVWRDDVRPGIVGQVSKAAQEVIDGTVDQVLGAQQLTWVTLGFLLAVWQFSGAVRAAQGILERLHGTEHDRTWRQRLPGSILLAIAVELLVVCALAVAILGSRLYGEVGQPLGAGLFLARHALAGALLLLAVGLVLHHGSGRDRHVKWVTKGALLIAGAWLVGTIGFGVYLTAIASYESVFGALTSVVVALAWIYLMALAFCAGAALDVLSDRSRRR